MALNPVDKLLAGYLAFVSLVVLVRDPLQHPENAWLLGMHALFGILLFLFTRLDATHRIGNIIHDVYPLLMVMPLYSEIGLLNNQLGTAYVFANDAFVQWVEASIFGGQISYTWIRNYPSVFWSGVLHLAYLGYYPIIAVGPVFLLLMKQRERARAVLLSTMIAFIACYVWFVLYPVGGPNWAFDHPTGPVRDVWSARIVYSLLEGGSAYGTALPSSHVAATTATTLALLRVWRGAGLVVIIPCILLIVATVYCQMHYAVDAATGLVVGISASMLAAKWRNNFQRSTSTIDDERSIEESLDVDR